MNNIKCERQTGESFRWGGNDGGRTHTRQSSADQRNGQEISDG